MLDNMLERVTAALESIADSLEVIAGKSGADVDASAPADPTPDTTTVAQAKEKKVRAKKKAEQQADPAPAPTVDATNTLFGNQPSAPADAAVVAEPPLSLDECNGALINAVNSGVAASSILDLLREYAPEANLRYIDASHYREIVQRVGALEAA